MRDGSDKLIQAQGLLESGQIDHAKALLLRTLPKSAGPVAAAMCRLLSDILLRQSQGGQTEQALYYAERAAQITPADAESHVQLGKAQWQLGRVDAALASARKAVQVNPGSRNAHGALINFLLREDRFVEALHACDAALARFPDDVEIAAIRGTMLLGAGKSEEAVAYLKEAAKREPGNLRLLGTLCPTLNYATGVDPAENLALHVAFGRALAAALPAGSTTKDAAFTNPPDPDRPLKLAFLSPDLRAHPMRHFAHSMFEHIDDSFHITCYFVGASQDAESERLRAVTESRTRANGGGGGGAWKHVPALHIGQLADLIKSDRIDLLIDLAGHTRFNRLGTMALRPAPVQLTFIGYPNTTGIAAIDYYIADRYCMPRPDDSSPAPSGGGGRVYGGGEAGGGDVHTLAGDVIAPHPHFSEKLLYVDPLSFCYRPIDDPPPVVDPPHVRNGFITFGSFNALMKLTDRVVACWAKVIKAVPESRLLVKNVQLMHPEAARTTRERFVAAGVPDDRLRVIGHKGTMHDHLATYGGVDIGLDTFPYAGMTTTCEALLMGVPAITQAQQSFASRVGLAILANVGLADLVAQSEEQFISTAAKLAADRPRLAELRHTLRGTFLASPVCDGPTYGRQISASLRAAWREWAKTKQR